jgi:hypothetical protein
MKQKKKLLCDVCGHPVKEMKDKIAAVNFYVCTNRICNYGRHYDMTRPEMLPEWVVVKNTYKGLERI